MKAKFNKEGRHLMNTTPAKPRNTGPSARRNKSLKAQNSEAYNI
jgi:hypothetical protein